MDVIDLRSDTVTQPTPAMRDAMARAVVGDDVFGDDPTVNRLQEIAAAKLGKQAGLFVPSGTMGNLTAMLAHCGRGDEVIMGSRSHTFLYEGGGLSTLGGVHSYQVKELADGSLPLDEVEAAIRPDDEHEPITRLVVVENTHNRGGGVFQSPETTSKLAELAHARGLAVHLDGARLFNAAVAQGVDVQALTRHVDSVTVCLSKGLCAPVGSVLCGSADFIRRARRWRKHLGGGMRQAGIIAAAGIVALESMVERLAEDHTRAKALAHSLRVVAGIEVAAPPTNMVFFTLADDVPCSAEGLERKLRERGVLILPMAPRVVRLVTHYWITDADITAAAAAIADVLK